LQAAQFYASIPQLANRKEREGDVADDPMIGRLRTALVGMPIREQKMFGGTCFMLSGNMLVGTSKRGLLVRVGKEAHAAAVSRSHAKPMEMGGRAMEGYVFVDEAGTKTTKDLNSWLKLARAFVETLPPKATKAPKAAKSKRAPVKGGRK
jgi:TfoX/Sxy family transcriptional regulator of competence genes